MTTKLSRDEFEAELHSIGEAQYHNNHPYHHRMHQGLCSIDEIRAWALNRFCYQRIIPVKDALVMARLDNVEDRREWRQRIVDHDGEIDDHPEGGLRRWLALTTQLGFSKDYVVSMQGALPATQFASNAYLTFVRERTVLEAVASSLTELFSPNIIAERVQGMLQNYDFITEDSLTYFSYRKSQANRDSNWTLDFIDRHASTREEQDRCLNALRFKCSMLWAMLDALASAYHLGGTIPPGVWDPQTQNGLLGKST
jgi:coenzyme PQQ biosynthesis protein C